MIFPYASYEVSRSTTIPGGVVYRPEVVIHVSSGSRSLAIQALVDTGSDETVLPISLAAILQIHLDDSLANAAAGVGGHEVRLIPGQVDLMLADGTENFRWKSTVSFLETYDPDVEVALLGFAGFLQYFTVSFDSEVLCVSLSPNSKFPGNSVS